MKPAKIDNSNLLIFLNRFGSFFLNLPESLFIICTLAFFTLKIGVRGILPWADFSPVENFPKPTQSISTNSIGILIFSKVFNTTNKNSFFILNLLILLFFLLIFYSLIRLKFANNPLVQRSLIIIFFASPIYTVLLGNVGRHDVLTIFGILFFFMSRKRFFFYMSLTIACLGSPEHLLAGLVLAFIASFAFLKTDLKKKLLEAISFNIIFLILVSIWAKTVASGESRFAVIIPYVDLAYRNFANNLLLEWYSYFGVFWFFLVYAIIEFNFRQRLIITGPIFFAMVFNIFMVDKTRDFVIAIFPTALVLLSVYFRKLALNQKLQKQKNLYFGLLIAVLVIFPQIEITFEGVPRAPWAWFISKAFGSM